MHEACNCSLLRKVVHLSYLLDFTNFKIVYKIVDGSFPFLTATVTCMKKSLLKNSKHIT
jgi:hypothetical protein